jgi:hypothetical protein
LENIYFLFRGAAGFVLLLPTNIVFLNVKERDEFGYLDLFYLSVSHNKTVG